MIAGAMSSTLRKRVGLLSALAVVSLWLLPIHSKLLCVAILLAFLGMWLGTFLSMKSGGGRRKLFVAISLFAFLLFFIPGDPIDPVELRRDYVERLRGYTGSTYLWGGEAALGIDCSGLPRKSLRDALLSYGLRHGSGPALRAWAEQWWFDTSARAMGQGYRGFTQALRIQGQIAGMDCDALEPGDLAVVDDGSHVLVYLGENAWIQADPQIGSVVILNGRQDQNRWFNRRVTIHRWSLLMKT